MEEINFLTLQLAKKYTDEHGGGGGGTSNYNDLSNKPQIGGTTLTGNKSASDLGLVAAENGKGLSTNDYTNEDKAIVGGVTAALAGKQNALTAGNNIKIDNDTISVNRWAVPAGKVVYTVITSDENYGQNVHVQRHTLGGAFIDDRTFTCVMYNTVDVDGLISIQNPYASFNITLLKDSDEQQAGYRYTVNPLTTPTSNSFTFTMEQEENANDLIIRSELDTAINAIKDGQSIDSFADVETALATKADLTDLAPAFSAASAYAVGKYLSYEGNIYKCTSAHSAGAWVAGDFTLVAVGSELESKQNATDNNLQTTDKTVVGAVNELRSGLTNYQTQNDLNLEVPDRKNLLNYDAWKTVDVARGSATWENNGVTLTASGDDCFTRFEPNYYPSDAKIYVKEGETITLSWEETTNKSGIVMIFPNGQIAGDAYVNNSDAKTVSYIVGSGITFVTFRFGVANSGDTISYKNIQIEMGSTATAYTPYIPSVESRIEAVESGLTNKQDKTDNNLMTTDKTIVGSINELRNSVDGNAYTVNGGSSVDISIGYGVYSYITGRDAKRFLTYGLIGYSWDGTPIVETIYASNDTFVTVTPTSDGKVTFSNGSTVSSYDVVLRRIV